MTVDPHNLSGAYALDALTEDERLAYEEHLAGCAECAAEIEGFSATAARLGAAAEEPLPAGLRAKVMTAAAQTPQERPTVSSMRSVSRLRQVATRVSLAAAALALIVSTAAYLVQRDDNADLRAQQTEITKVLSAKDTAMVTSELADGGSVRLVRSRDLDRAVLVVNHLPELDSGHDYQMWTIASGKPTSAGLLARKDQTGTSSHLMSGIANVNTVAITVEPAGGSKQPTTKPIANLVAT